MTSEPSTKDLERWLGMMRKRDPQIQEDGFHALLPHARRFVGPLATAFASETDHGLRCWLLELLGEARDAQLTETFLTLLDDPDYSIRWWATAFARYSGRGCDPCLEPAFGGAGAVPGTGGWGLADRTGAR